jgi:histidine phosphotransfer protein HptB
MARLDSRAIAELRDLMGDEFNALIEVFRSDSLRLVEAIDEAAAQNDAEKLRHQSHGLKGACINLGAVDLAALCADIEAVGRSGDCGAARELLAPLRCEYEAVSAALDSLKS